jgi:hypothetical protein
MDAFVQGLKRTAEANGDINTVWRYARALERIISDGCSDLRLWQIMGHDGDVRPIYYCVARDEAGVRAQFEETLTNINSWGRVLWDHVFEDYAGPVDGWQQPLHLLVSHNTQLPLACIPGGANILTISKIKLNEIFEFC